MQPESPPPAPAVVAVVVTCDPGPWFEETLLSLAAQDYPNLSVLVIDSGSNVDPTPAVASVLPGAFVRRLDRRVPFGQAANEVLSIVEGASHLLLCHDDVALAPDAVRQLVEEAFRSNAGLASPKYVLWDQPEHLLAVGLTTDKVGAVRDLADRGELDQEQHDSVRDVLVAPGGALLVRSDLFAAVGGFDPAVGECGEDLNLSWRVRLAGARVLAVPAARVRHLEATRNGLRGGRRARPAASELGRADANRYRTLLTCYRWHTLLWVLPLAMVWAAGEAVTFALGGRWQQGWAALAALGAAVANPRQLRSARAKVQKGRVVGDGALRVLQVRGNVRLRQFLQTRFEDVRSGLGHQVLSNRHAAAIYGPEPDADGREVAAPEPASGPRDAASRSRKLTAFLLVTVLVLLILGSRSLLGSGMPQVGTLPDTSGGWASIWRQWWSAWQPVGLGVAAPSSPAIGLIGVLSTVLFGAVGTAEHVLVLGPLLLGPLGVWRACRGWGSRGGRAAAVVAYTIVPLPYNALASGRWDGLVAYGLTPWVISGLIRISGLVPLPAVPVTRIWGRLVGLGLLVAVVASVAPSYLYVVLLVGLLLLLGSAVAGQARAALRLLGVSVVAFAVAFVVLVPWSPTVIGSKAALFGPDLGAAGRLGLGKVMRFDTGAFGGGGWEWLLLVAAALPLLVGREWRLEWAARMWVVALGCFFFAWAGSRGWIPAFPPDVVLAPAAVALAASVALGVSAFEIDLPAYRFGWRQGAAAVAAATLALASVPFIAATSTGRWKLPSADASSVLAFLPGARSGDYRVLWVGAPSGLPLASRQLEKGFGYATSYDGEPSLAEDWTTGSAGASGQLATDLLLAQDRLTTKLGHLLGLAGVRYLVVPNHAGPSGSGAPAVPVPSSLLAGLRVQTDLQALNVGDPDYTVYQNSAWAPVKSVLPAEAAALSGEPAAQARRDAQQADLSQAKPVLAGGRSGSSSGSVEPSTDLYVAQTSSSGWHLDVSGRTVRPTRAFGWAMSFAVPASGSAAGTEAELSYGAPALERVGYIVGAVLWVAAVLGIVLERARRHRPGVVAESSNPEWFTPAAPVQSPSARTPGRPRSPGRPGSRQPAPAGVGGRDRRAGDGTEMAEAVTEAGWWDEDGDGAAGA